MAATKGNQYWKLMKRHGRKEKFSSPESLWDEACKYFDWCSTNKYKCNRTKRKGDFSQIYTENAYRPFSIAGLCLYLNASVQWWYSLKGASRKKEDKDLFDIITRIEEIIETQQFEGASVGVFNANIIARKLGLMNKQQQEVNAKVSGLIISIKEAGG